MSVYNSSWIRSNFSKGTVDARQNDSYFNGEFGNLGIPIMRIDAALIFFENVFVALCLYTERNKFPKKEFWLQLFSLTLNDIYVSLTLFLWSFVKSDSFNKNVIGCAFLAVIVLVSQMAFLFNVLSICVYRLMFLVCTDRYRFGWKPKTTVIQVTSIYSMCFLYVVIPIAVWGNRNITIENCLSESLFEPTGRRKAHIFIGTGLFLPLIVLNVLYGVTFHILRGHLRRRQRSGHHYKHSQLSSRSSSGQLRSAADQNTSRSDQSHGRHDVADRVDHCLIQLDQEQNQPKVLDCSCSRTESGRCRADSQTDDCCSRTGYGCNGMDCCRCREDSISDYSRSRSEPSSSRTEHSRSRADHNRGSGLVEQTGKPHSSTDEGTSGDTRTTSKRSSHEKIELSLCSVEYKPGVITRISNQKAKTPAATAYVPTSMNISRNVQNYTLTRKGQKSAPMKGVTTTASRGSDLVDRSARESQKQSLFLIGLILLLIDITTAPCVVYLVAEQVFLQESFPEFVKSILLLLVMNNSLLNPWLYAIQSKEVRGAITHSMRKLCCRKCTT